jgi:E3 ubiquitin-protein ligase RAD18
LREAVDAFVRSRDTVLQFAKAPIESGNSNTPKRKAIDLDEQREDPPENKRPRMTTRSSKAKAVEATAAIMREEVDAVESEESADYEPEIGTGTVPLTRTGHRITDTHYR